MPEEHHRERLPMPRSVLPSPPSRGERAGRVSEPSPGPLPTPPPASASVVLGAVTLGVDAGRPTLSDLGWGDSLCERAPLERERAMLPELEAPPPPRPLRRQPAFIVAMSAAGAAILALAGTLVVQTVFLAPATVEAVRLTDLGDNLLLQWEGPDVPYSVMMTSADFADPADLSAMIKGGRDAWIPRNAAGVSSDACFVVRTRAAAEQFAFTEVATELVDQGGARICAVDAGRG